MSDSEAIVSSTLPVLVHNPGERRINKIRLIVCVLLCLVCLVLYVDLSTPLGIPVSTIYDTTKTTSIRDSGNSPTRQNNKTLSSTPAIEVERVSSSSADSSTTSSAASTSRWCGEWIPNRVENDTMLWEPRRPLFRNESVCSNSSVGEEYMPNPDHLYFHPNLYQHGRVASRLVFDMQRHTETTGTPQVVLVQPEYSIITPTFSAATTLPLTIPSLCNYTVGLWEIVLIIDGSWDDSLHVLVTILTSDVCIGNYGLLRARILFQPNSIYETSSDNLGFTLAKPSHFYIEVQADMAITEYGWNRDLVRPFFEYCDIVTVSGRCGHNQNNAKHVGRCSNDVENTSEVARNETLDAVFYSGTNNRGPWAVHAQRFRELGYLDEINFFLGNDDHDLNRRAFYKGWRATYRYTSFFAPLQYSANRNADLTKTIPDHAKQRDKDFRKFRESLYNDSCDPLIPPKSYAADDPVDIVKMPLLSLRLDFDWNEQLPPFQCD
jgi:glycosyltransferase involved in cell wall biosynthesis